jgi:flagellar motor component MotA
MCIIIYIMHYKVNYGGGFFNTLFGINQEDLKKDLINVNKVFKKYLDSREYKDLIEECHKLNSEIRRKMHKAVQNCEDILITNLDHKHPSEPFYDEKIQSDIEKTILIFMPKIIIVYDKLIEIYREYSTYMTKLQTLIAENKLNKKVFDDFVEDHKDIHTEKKKIDDHKLNFITLMKLLPNYDETRSIEKETKGGIKNFCKDFKIPNYPFDLNLNVNENIYKNDNTDFLPNLCKS